MSLSLPLPPSFSVFLMLMYRDLSIHKVLQDALCSRDRLVRNAEYNGQKTLLVSNEIVLALKEDLRRDERKKADDRSLRPSNDNDNAVMNDRTIFRFN